MDAALKNPSKRRRRGDGIVRAAASRLEITKNLTALQDVSTLIDEEIASMRNRMSEAAELDVEARSHKPPRLATNKLRLLPEVTSLLNRNPRDYVSAIVDPENNLLQAVRYFLEPTSDGKLPAYNIQRDLFACLARLPIDKEALIASGIAKIVLFYTKSKQPEVAIKREAEELVADWTRPILEAHRKRVHGKIEVGPIHLALRNGPNGTSASARQLSATEAVAQARERARSTGANLLPRHGRQRAQVVSIRAEE